MSLLEVKDLKTYFYTDAGCAKAVDGVSFSLDKGKVLGIVGESGCGKSVTSLSIMGLVDPVTGRHEGGEILFHGEDLSKLSEKEKRKIRGNKISMIFQEPMTSLNPVFTVGYQIEEALMLHLGMDKNAARQRAVELLKLVEIPEAEKRVDEYPHQLSGGMRQRVMIAMALSCNPELLIADEPTTALDVTIQAQILELLNELRTSWAWPSCMRGRLWKRRRHASFLTTPCILTRRGSWPPSPTSIRRWTGSRLWRDWFPASMICRQAAGLARAASIIRKSAERTTAS